MSEVLLINKNIIIISLLGFGKVRILSESQPSESGTSRPMPCVVSTTGAWHITTNAVCGLNHPSLAHHDQCRVWSQPPESGTSRPMTCVVSTTGVWHITTNAVCALVYYSVIRIIQLCSLIT